MTRYTAADLGRLSPDVRIGNPEALAQTPPDAVQGELSEYETQQLFFTLVAGRCHSNPDYLHIVGSANGQYRPGQRKEPGISRGFPDIACYLPQHGYHGGFWELKVGRNTPTVEQEEWIERLRAAGYYAVVIYGLDELWQDVQWYVEGEEA